MSEKETTSVEISNNEKLFTMKLTSRVYSGQYRELFEEAETVLGDKATVFDYHQLYRRCLNYITWNLCENIEMSAKGNSEHTSYNKEVSRYKKLRNELDAVFYEFAIKIESPNTKILKRLEKKFDKLIAEQNNNHELTPKIIGELIDNLQLKPEPINGKYRPTSDNDRQFVFWIVENNYDDYLSSDNYFLIIHCNLKKDTINRYFLEARDERERLKNSNKNKKV